MGAQKSRLPAAYQEVRYLQSSGTQYIDTGITGSSETELSVDIYSNNTSQQYNRIAGRFDLDNNASITMIYWINAEPSWRFGSNSQGVSKLPGAGRHLFTTSISGGYVDGVKKVNWVNQTAFASQLTLYLCANIPQAANGLIGNIYSATIKTSGVKTGEFIPCYRKADNVPGMYDIVRNIFFVNAGSGNFVVGPDVN